MQKIDGEKLHLIVPNDQLATIDRIAARLKLTRSQTIRNLLDVGVTVFEDFERIGVVRIAEILGKTKKALKTEIGQQSLFKA